MPIELTANTEAGARLVALAESLADELAAHAPQHDRAGTYPFESIAALMSKAGFIVVYEEGARVRSWSLLAALTEIARITLENLTRFEEHGRAAHPVSVERLAG